MVVALEGMVPSRPIGSISMGAKVAMLVSNKLEIVRIIYIDIIVGIVTTNILDWTTRPRVVYLVK